MALISIINHVAPSLHLLYFTVIMSVSLTRLFDKSWNYSNFVTTEYLVLGMMAFQKVPKLNTAAP